MKTTVIKIGGSLLSEPGSMERIAEWLASTSCPNECRVFLAGGGATVEGLRTVDAANPLPAERSHWAAIALMDLNAQLLAEWLPQLTFTTELPSGPGDWSLAAGAWMLAEEPELPGERLEVGWQTTSDSISARIAEVMGANLLVVKHSLEGTYATTKAAAEAGLIDPRMPVHAANLGAIQVTDLRWAARTLKSVPDESSVELAAVAGTQPRNFSQRTAGF